MLRNVFQALAWLLVACLLGPSLPRHSVAAEPASVQSAVGAYDALWLTAGAELLAAVQAAPPAGAEQLPAGFTRASAALNQQVAQLLETSPPAQRMHQHLVLLPLLAEATAAVQAIEDAARAHDVPALEAARAWLAESCLRLRQEAVAQ